jgi:hypothetical protein
MVITRWLFFKTKTISFWFIKTIRVDSVKTHDPGLGPGQPSRQVKNTVQMYIITGRMKTHALQVCFHYIYFFQSDFG